MISQVTLHNFKTHADTTLKLGRFTVLVGPNGSGKTSVLSALHLLSLFEEDRLKTERLGHSKGVLFGHGEPSEVRRFGANDFLIEARNGQAYRQLRFGLTQNRNLTPEFSGFPVPRQTTRFEKILGEDTPSDVLDLQIASSAKIQFNTQKLAEPNALSDSAQVQSDGAGLADVIATLKLYDCDRLKAIVDDLRVVVPETRDLRVEPIKHESGTRLRLLVDFAHAKGVRAHAVSEGTLIVIGLLTLLHAEDRPRLILMDDIERGLHPLAQWELVKIIRRMLEQDPELQIVATTHSAYLVDEMEASEVWVMALDEAGVTQCRCLADHPRADLLDVLSTGELLSAEGERWVLEPTDAKSSDAEPSDA